MKILYFYQYFTTTKGSYNPRVYEFTRRWVKAGHQVTVITSLFDRSDLRSTQFISNLTVEGVNLRVLNIGLSNKHGIPHRLCTFLTYALLACWYALVLPADVVLVSSPPMTVGLPGLVSRYVRRRPLVFEVRDLWTQGAIEMGYLTNPLLIRIARLFDKICFRAATNIVALSQGMADWIKDTYGVSSVEVVPNASDNEFFGKQQDKPGGLPSWAQERRTLIYAGNMGPGDDCGQILDMAKCLRDDPRARDVEVVLIGDGRQGLFLRERARHENLPARFLGLMPREDLVRFLRSAFCAVFTTKNLPFYNTCSPNKLFDALAAGLPVIQTTQGWIKNLIECEDCGITVPQNDPLAFAEAVLQVLNSPALRRRFGENAKRLAREQFDRELLSTKMLDLVAVAVQNGRVLVGRVPHHRLTS